MAYKSKAQARANQKAWAERNREKRRAASAAWRKRHPEKALAATKAWEAKNPERVAQWQRKGSRKRAGVTNADGSTRVGPCEICTLPSELVQDHDHETGRVRGWLCQSCNRGIGLLRDSVSVLKCATHYLEKRQCES